MGVFRDRDEWRAEVYFEGRRIKTKRGFRTKKLAEDWLEDQRSLYRKDGVPQKTSAKTFDDALSYFAEKHLPFIGATCANRYQNDIDHHIKPFFAYAKLTKLTPAVFDAFKAELAKTLAPSTANNTLSLVHLILEKAVRAGLIAENPYDVEPLPEPDAEYDWWDDKDDIRRFLRHAEATRYYGAYFLALETGMRFGEVVGLWRQAIDFKRGAIYVERQWKEEIKDYDLPKHRKTRWVYFDPKGPFAKVLKAAAEASPHPHLVFPTKTGGHVTKAKLGGKYLQAIIGKAKVKRLTFHDLRHTFASWYMREHDNVWALMALLGHADIKTTLKYAHHGKTRQHKPLGLIGSITPKSLPKRRCGSGK